MVGRGELLMGGTRSGEGRARYGEREREREMRKRTRATSRRQRLFEHSSRRGGRGAARSPVR
eukprot:scaffold146007_cov14-Tisochrysis_lutea.AAC.1